jgi:hypothetical protein
MKYVNTELLGTPSVKDETTETSIDTIHSSVHNHVIMEKVVNFVDDNTKSFGGVLHREKPMQLKVRQSCSCA